VRRVLRLGSHELPLGGRTLVMGILNATPDSFYDQGRHYRPDAALARARELVEGGADVIDIGGQTGQVGQEIPVEEEIRRVCEVIPKVAALGVAVSVDTYRAPVARAAIEAGAVLVNDYTGFADPQVPAVAAAAGVGLVCAHYHGRPRSNPSRSYEVSVDQVVESLASRRQQALGAGVGEESILLDPCFGFGKSTASDISLMAAIPLLRRLGAPLLVAVSHKEFTADQTGLEESDLRGTLAAAVLAARDGAEMVRLHDVAEIAPALRLADAVRNAREVPA
jgi:dihydropteroate synthase